MASVVTEIAATLLIFTCVVQGTQSLQIVHEKSLNATVGQDISLPCFVAENHKVNINQIEWDVKTPNGSKRLVVFNPLLGTHYIVPVKLELVNRTNSTMLQGSILHLHNVTEEHSGIYICDITTFPDGSWQSSTTVQVMEPWISAKVAPPGKSLIEGEEVNITCASNPSADTYILSSLQTDLFLENQSGQFTIKNVTRHNSELICRPRWTSSNQKFQNLQKHLRMTVDYIDGFKCNSTSQLQVEMGTSLTITCEATSSRPLSYIWMKGNVTVSQNSTISLWLVNPELSGMYSVTVYAENHGRLQRTKYFEVNVLNRTDAGSTIIMETTSQIMDGTTPTTSGPETTTPTTSGPESTTPTTSGPETTPTTMTQPGRTSSPAYSTNTEPSLYYNTTAPSAGNITTSHPNITKAHAKITTSHANITTSHVNVTVKSNATWSYSLNTSAEGSTRSEGCCQWQNTTSSLKTTREEFNHAQPVTSTTSVTSNSTLVTLQKVAEQSGKNLVVVFVLIPMLLLLVLIGFLYRRYRIQKRMDMPPPFKPPPPPVKYTSVRSHDIPVTDILV